MKFRVQDKLFISIGSLDKLFEFGAPWVGEWVGLGVATVIAQSKTTREWFIGWLTSPTLIEVLEVLPRWRAPPPEQQLGAKTKWITILNSNCAKWH